ncbi:MmgE/PrpD family protein [Chloroflexota bacterium]
MSEITRELAKFALETRWEDLPEPIINETKLVLMESIGCGIAALSTSKGKMNLALARRYGGPPESSIVGTDSKVSCSNAALANGELFLALDYTNIMAGGHDGVYVIPTVLAIAENAGASGKDLILANTLGFEVSARIARAVGRHNITPQAVQRQRGGPPGITGNAYSNFGAAAGAGRLLKFDANTMLNALGVAGHLCMVLSYGRWGAGKDRYMAKYGVPGWQSTGAVAAVLLAEMGYTGDTTVLDDPERGFHYFAGYKNWYPEEILDGLGKSWCFNIRLHYKPYPCCAVFHGTLDCFCSIIEQNNLTPEEIESVKVYGRATMDSPLFGRKEIDSISGAQFNPRYNISVAAHRVPVGADWVEPETMKNPGILNFMDKITLLAHPDYAKQLEKDPISNLSKAEVVARGKTFAEERKYRRGTAGTDVRWTEKDAVEKFRHNTERVLPKDKIDRAVEALLNLEKIDNISELMSQITV